MVWPPSIGYGQGLLCLECMKVTVSPLTHLCSPEVFKSSQESLVDAFAGAATAIAKAFSPKPLQDVAATSTMGHSAHFSPGKKVEIRMKNLEQLRILQNLMEDGILSRDEFTEQKRIVLQSLNNLV